MKEKIKLFEEFNNLDVYYEIRVGMPGEDEPLKLESDDYDYNPYDLGDTYKLYMKYKDKYTKGLIRIAKISYLSEEEINDIKRKFTTDKYNI